MLQQLLHGIFQEINHFFHTISIEDLFCFDICFLFREAILFQDKFDLWGQDLFDCVLILRHFGHFFKLSAISQNLLYFLPLKKRKIYRPARLWKSLDFNEFRKYWSRNRLRDDFRFKGELNQRWLFDNLFFRRMYLFFIFWWWISSQQSQSFDTSFIHIQIKRQPIFILVIMSKFLSFGFIVGDKAFSGFFISQVNSSNICLSVFNSENQHLKNILIHFSEGLDQFSFKLLVWEFFRFLESFGKQAIVWIYFIRMEMQNNPFFHRHKSNP